MNITKKYCFRKLFDNYVSTLFNKVEKFVLDSVNGDEELANKIILKACTNYSLKIEQIKGNKCLKPKLQKTTIFQL